MRLFIAADLPESVLEALAETSAQLRSCVCGRYVAPDSFHVTLAFLGQVEAFRVPDVEEALDACCASAEAFEVQLGELGSFGKPAKATLWQAVRDAGELAHLAAGVRSGLAAAGFSFDGKGFVPHVTLMRAADLRAGLLPPAALAQGRVEALALYESDLSGPHPRYEALHRVFLKEPL